MGRFALLLQFQRFFLPGLVCLTWWSAWRTIVRRDAAIGLALYVGVVVVVDGFLKTGIYLPGLEKGSIRYSEVCAAFLLLTRPSGEGTSGNRGVTFLAVGYFALLFISALRADPLVAGVFEFRELVVPQIVAFLVARRGLGAPAEYRRFLLALTALLILIGLFTFWDVFFDITLLKSRALDAPIYWHNRQQGRFGSFFLNPNYLGTFAVLVFPMFFMHALSVKSWWQRMYVLTGLLALVFSLVETQSRGPLLGFAATLLLLGILPGGAVSRKLRLGSLLLFGSVLLLFMPGFYLHAVERFSSIDREASLEEVSRKSVWLYTRRIIADHPIGGIGFGESQYIRTMEEYGFSARYQKAPVDNPHNSYLQVAVYAGLPALTAFLLANGVILARAARATSRGSDVIVAPIIVGLAVGIAGFMLVIYPDMCLFTSNVAPVYWVCFGLLKALTGAGPVSEQA